jgi:hypothetical protein
MEKEIDFLNIKSLIKTLLVFGAILFAGSILKDIAALLVAIVIVYFLIKGNHYRTMEYWLIWYLCYNFYQGQLYFNISVVENYVANPPKLLFLIFIYNFNYIRTRLKDSVLNKGVLAFSVSLLLGSLINGQSIFAFIDDIPFFLIFFIFIGFKFDDIQSKGLLNLFIAIGILQSVVSFLQVGQIIPPPTTIMDDGGGGINTWVAGLDDVASGTFGASASHLTSWYAALVGFFLILVFAILKKIKYFIFAAICLIQFATVDSKTIMGITVVMFSYLMLIYLPRCKNEFKLDVPKLFISIFLVAIFGFGLKQGINAYYVYFSEQTGTSARANLDAVYEDEVSSSFDIVMEDPLNWGKIKGPVYVLEDFTKEGMLTFLFGYGPRGYDYNGKMMLIENMDAPKMQLDSFTKSRSGFIAGLARFGTIGAILLFYMIFKWYKINNSEVIPNDFEPVKKGLLNIFLPFTLITSSLYSVSFSNIPVIMLSALVGILINYEQNNKED